MRKALPYIGLVLLVMAICFLFKYKKPHVFDDRITLSYHDKIPYGTYAAYNLLKKEFPHAKIETNRYAPADWKTLSSDSTKQVLLIVTKIFNPSEADLDYLTDFVQQGNYVFISALQLTGVASKFFTLTQKDHYSFYNLMPVLHHHFNAFDSTVVNLDANIFKTPLVYQYPGADFTNEFFKTDSSFTYPLGYSAKANTNFAAVKSMKGTFFLHTAPIVFTNFFLLYVNNKQYYERLLSLLPSDAKKIVWDEYYLYHYNNDKPKGSQGILSVILKYENFRWAFWIALLLLFLYITTEIKRKQRIIPNYEKPKNESLEFVTTIGKLYYEKADHKNLAEKLTQYFLDYVRNTFKMSTSELNSSFVLQLAAKSNKPADEVNTIIESIHTIFLSDTISQKQLMDYYERLEKFYQTI